MGSTRLRFGCELLDQPRSIANGDIHSTRQPVGVSFLSGTCRLGTANGRSRSAGSVGRKTRRTHCAFSSFNSFTPVLSRAFCVAVVGRLSRNPCFYAGRPWALQAHTRRLKTGAITSGGSRIVGAPSFSPYHPPRRPFALSPFRACAALPASVHSTIYTDVLASHKCCIL
jgi:hypothetical protein